MFLSTDYLEYGRHVVRLHRRRRRRAYAPTSNTASHDNHDKISSWVPFSFLYEYGAPLGGPSGRRSSAIKLFLDMVQSSSTDVTRALRGRFRGGFVSFRFVLKRRKTSNAVGMPYLI